MLLDWSLAETVGYHEGNLAIFDTKEIPKQHILKDMLPLL